MPEPAWRGDVAVEDTVVRTRARTQGDVAPQLADVADHAEHGVSPDRSVSSSCTVIGTCSRPSGRTAGWDRSDRSGRPWPVRYPAIRAADADWSSTVAGQDGRGFNGGSVLTGSPSQRCDR